MLATRSRTGPGPGAEGAAPGETGPAVGPPRRGGVRRWLVVALVVVLVAAVVALTLAWRNASDRADRLDHANDLRASALAAATKYAVDLTTYDHARLGAQQRRLKAESTARFQHTFADSMKTLGPIFKRVRASATGKVTAAAVAKVDDAHATVIAFVDQTAKSTEIGKPQDQASRVKLSLVRRDGRWLLDQVKLV